MRKNIRKKWIKNMNGKQAEKQTEGDKGYELKKKKKKQRV